LAAITASEPVTMKMDIKLTHAKNDSKWNKIFELQRISNKIAVSLDINPEWI
jgi:hypothetical protein